MTQHIVQNGTLFGYTQPFLLLCSDQYSDFDHGSDQSTAVFPLFFFRYRSAAPLTRLPDVCLDYLFLQKEETLLTLQPSSLPMNYPASDEWLTGLRLPPGCTLKLSSEKKQELFSFLNSSHSTGTSFFEELSRRFLPVESLLVDSNVLSPYFTALYGRRGGVTVEELSELTSYSVRQVNRLFHQYASLSPHECSRLIRFQYALLEMLQHPQEAVSYYIQNLSYSDQAHFQREFKSLAGITPKRFLKMVSEVLSHRTAE